MSEATFVAPRRSGRVFHKMRVKAQGRDHDGRKFREVCETLVVNSHGGLLMLKNEIDDGEMLVLTNPDTDEEQECRVVFLGDAGDRGQVDNLKVIDEIAIGDFVTAWQGGERDVMQRAVSHDRELGSRCGKRVQKRLEYKLAEYVA